MKKKKLFFKYLILPWVRWIAYLFYDKRYLVGKDFSPDSLTGWGWVISGLWRQKILGLNRGLPFPCAPSARIFDHKNLFFHPDTLDNFQSPGIYFDSVRAKIYIGKGTLIAANVGLITANHRVNELSLYEEGKDIVLGEYCWIGMNSVVLPGVVLGDHTIVGAGSVVTKSFPEGHCIIVGSPARLLRKI